MTEKGLPVLYALFRLKSEIFDTFPRGKGFTGDPRIARPNKLSAIYRDSEENNRSSPCGDVILSNKSTWAIRESPLRTLMHQRGKWQFGGLRKGEKDMRQGGMRHE